VPCGSGHYKTMFIFHALSTPSSLHRRAVSARSPRALAALSLCVTWLGCGDTALKPIETSGESNGDGDGDEQEEEEVDAGSDESIAECQDGDTETCTCTDGTTIGERACDDGYFGICSGCPALDETSKCVGGVYEGPLTGTYNGGIPGWIAFYPYKVDATLRLSLNHASGEFATIGDGCMRSGDQGGGMAGWITGTVDCGTGELAGVLRAYYRMQDFFSGKWYKVFFKGKTTARYNADTKTFEMGQWSGAEPPGLLSNASGGGAWQGIITDETPSQAGSIEECLGEPFPEERFK
jgi:hypothetical protein